MTWAMLRDGTTINRSWRPPNLCEGTFHRLRWQTGRTGVGKPLKTGTEIQYEVLSKSNSGKTCAQLVGLALRF